MATSTGLRARENGNFRLLMTLCSALGCENPRACKAAAQRGCDKASAVAVLVRSFLGDCLCTTKRGCKANFAAAVSMIRLLQALDAQPEKVLAWLVEALPAARALGVHIFCAASGPPRRAGHGRRARRWSITPAQAVEPTVCLRSCRACTLTGATWSRWSASCGPLLPRTTAPATATAPRCLRACASSRW